MNRQQAVQWCVDNIIEWPEFKPSIAPDGWYWTECFGRWVLDKNAREVPIDKHVWFNFKHMSEKPTYSKGYSVKYISQQVFMSTNNPNATQCGQSFSDLMKELNNA